MPQINVDLDVRAGGTAPRVNLSQYDQETKLVFTITDDGTEYTETITAAELHARRPDGKACIYSAEVSGSTITCDLTKMPLVTYIAGSGTGEIWLTVDGSVLPTENFRLYIEEAPVRDGDVQADGTTDVDIAALIASHKVSQES